MTDTDEIHPALRSALDTIRRHLGPGSNDSDAACWSIECHAMALEDNAVVMPRAIFEMTLLRYAVHVASVACGEVIEVVDLGDGELAIKRTGQRMGTTSLHAPDVPSTIQ